MSLSRLDYRRLAQGAAGAVFAALLGLAHAQTGSTPLIWEARSPTNTVYLFGTIHVGARKMYPLSPAVEQAYAAARVVALEADPTDESTIIGVVQRAAYKPPDNLANHVSPALMENLNQMLPSIGLPIEYARSMRPALLAMSIAMMEIGRQGYDPSLGLDIQFAQRAKQDGKRIVELESIEGQLTLLDGFSPELQESMLRATLDSIKDGTLAADAHELVSAWSAGNPERMLKQFDKEADELPAAQAAEMRERLYDARNREMADKVIAMLAGSEPTFIAVGVAHLLGPSGIIELLRKRGYQMKKL